MKDLTKGLIMIIIGWISLYIGVNLPDYFNNWIGGMWFIFILATPTLFIISIAYGAIKNNKTKDKSNLITLILGIISFLLLIWIVIKAIGSIGF